MKILVMILLSSLMIFSSYAGGSGWISSGSPVSPNSDDGDKESSEDSTEEDSSEAPSQ